MAQFRVNLFHWRRALAQFRHWRIVFVLFLILVITYPYAPSFSLPTPPRTLRKARAEVAPVPDPRNTRHLWSYISEYAEEQRAERNGEEEPEIMILGEVLPKNTYTWEWINSKQRSLAPSAGGLRSQGAKASFRTNLRQDKKYFQGYMTSGWNNEIMDTANVIYVAKLTNRIPILMAFEPHHEHLGGKATTVAIGEIFDLAYLSSVLNNMPIVEAHELKIALRQSPRLQRVKKARPPSANGRRENLPDEWIPAVQELEDDYMSCWKHRPQAPNPLYLPFQKMDLHRTPVSRSTLYKNDVDKPSIYKFADLLRDYRPGQIPADSLEMMEGKEPAIPPDDHVACLDNTYFMLTDPARGGLHDEWRAGYGVWHHVGQYMRFQPALQQITDDFLRDLMGVAWNDPVPLFMTVHIRRGDFSDWFKAITPIQWAHKVQTILVDLRDRMGMSIEHVVVATDETDEEWLAPLRQYGFHIIDHKKTKTAERLDHWFPTIIDNIILASGQVFLGIPASTMSILAMRRTIEWNSGFGYFFYDSNHRVPEGWTWHISDLAGRN